MRSSASQPSACAATYSQFQADLSISASASERGLPISSVIMRESVVFSARSRLAAMRIGTARSAHIMAPQVRLARPARLSAASISGSLRYGQVPTVSPVAGLMDNGMRRSIETRHRAVLPQAEARIATEGRLLRCAEHFVEVRWIGKRGPKEGDGTLDVYTTAAVPRVARAS